MNELNLRMRLPDGFGEKSKKNLLAILVSKGYLITKACRASEINTVYDGDCVTFILRYPQTVYEPKAAAELFPAIVMFAHNSKWISDKVKPVTNERYAFRTFLNRIGLGGDVHHAARTALLSNLSGDSAYVNGRPQKSPTAARYYSVLRPVSAGTFPKTQEVVGFLNFKRRRLVPEIGREAWGYIDFAAPISEEDAIQYDLVKA